ncbi:hypothetical protein [uncultured Rikenella sp.]|uniref:hypothetical protein n=1 Tax=uncultured Rikenella sp. TaxID=368003 RepID=UPI00262A526A|nr:hypothetical protein [uncultured Rikenella sp.]
MPLRINRAERRAPGYRGRNTGTPDGGGKHGSSWSISPDNAQGSYLDFHTTSLLASTANDRTFGFPLRCLSE